jgi:hypothetical protein
MSKGEMVANQNVKNRISSKIFFKYNVHWGTWWNMGPRGNIAHGTF